MRCIRAVAFRGGVMSKSPGYIYAADYMKQLDPDQLGMFEPVSGIMLINRSQDEFAETVARFIAGQCTNVDTELFRAINHEVYHFAQTIASGYAYDRQYQLFSIIEAKENWSGLEERVA